MQQKTIQILLALLRSAICDEKLTNKDSDDYSSEMLPALLKISIKHDVAHLLVLGLKKNNLISKDDMWLEQYISKAVFRYEQLNYENERICMAFEKAQIPFIPLKGSIIRKYYPESWMRTSCDVDVLVHEEDAEKAVDVLVKEYGYTFRKKTPHDMSLYTPNHSHIELHYDLVEDGVANNSSNILRTVWETVINRKGFSFLYDMTDEMYYFYHIAHAAKHFEHGGCGIRSLMDIWILDNLQEKDINKRNKLLEKGNLLKFAESSRLLSKVWFDNAEHTDVTKQMEDYILRGGVYGNNENAVAVQQQKKGGRIKYALSKIFLPYDRLKYYYPILQKHRWLTPFIEVRRWVKIIFSGQARQGSVKELQNNNNISREEARQIQEFLENIGL